MTFSIQEAFGEACRQLGEANVQLALLTAENEELRNQITGPGRQPEPDDQP